MDFCYGLCFYHHIMFAYFEGAAFGINSDGFFELEKLPQYVFSICKCLLQLFTLMIALRDKNNSCNKSEMQVQALNCSRSHTECS